MRKRSGGRAGCVVSETPQLHGSFKTVTGEKMLLIVLCKPALHLRVS